MKRVLIIGGGITGLAAAYRLEQLPDVQVTLVEKETRLGGKLFTEQVDGFVVEAGADSFLSRKPRGVGLCEELGVAERLCGRDPRHNRTFIRRHGQLHSIPEGLSGLVPTNLDALNNTPLLSAAGKARVAQELHIPPAADPGDESIAAFMSRRMGREVYEELVEPLMSGIYAGDGSQLSLAATFPQLRQIEQKYGSLLYGLANPAAQPTRYPPFVSFLAGMATMIDLLLACLQRTTILTGVGVLRLERAPFGYVAHREDGQRMLVDAVIVATPAYVAARLVEPLDRVLAEAHAAIPHASSVTVTLGYAAADLPQPLDGYGYVIPRVEGTDVLACTWSSSKWAGRAPDGFVQLRLYLGRYGGRDVLALSDEDLLAMAQGEVEETMGITARPPLQRLYRWLNGMPQYTIGHLVRLMTIEERLLHHPGLFLAGAAYRGVGIPDCIASGEQAAAAASEFCR
jgi:oxygen-dependent protoporphyrinogen oxidase